MQWTEEELDELGITGLGQDAKPFDEVFRNINDFLPSSSDYELLDNCANTYAQLASEWVGQIDEIMRETTLIAIVARGLNASFEAVLLMSNM
jgi:hypothetical protein